MLYRRFGKTELQMPVITCGGMRFQQAWKDLEADEIEAESQQNVDATVRRALELGVNHIETARGYGSSERQLGRVLPHLPRESMIVQTKAPPKADGKEFRQLFETSMERLKLDYVDMLALHGINTAEMLDMSLKPGGSLAEARRLQDEGRVRFVGFSTHGPAECVVAAIESGDFDYVNLHWYYVDQRNAAAIDAARERDMGVLIISPCDKGGRLYEPPERLVDLCSPLTPMGFNDLFCLSREDVHTLSIGAARPSDFDAHVAVVPLLADAAERIGPVLARLEAAVCERLGHDWAANWQKGIPHWERVPGQVNLYQTLRLYTLWKAFDMLGYAQARYNLLGSGGHWFPGYKVNSMECDKLADCLTESPFADRIPAILREAHEALDTEDKKRLSESG